MRSQRITRYRGAYAVVWYDEKGYRHRRSLGKVSKSEAYAVANRVIAAATAPRDRRLTRDEMTALINECKQPHLLLFVLIARYTAARASAILSLKWPQIDFERRRIDLGGSGRQKRRAVIPMHPHLALALAIAREAAVSPFVVEYGGRRVASIKKGFAAACDRAEIKDASPHILRHTAASWMAEAGVSMDEIAQFLGHTNSSVTFRVYARFSPDHLRSALEGLE